ncbi:MAG: hypothetical protein ABEJ61_01200 [Haloferacaceae archaeon]
MPTRRAVLAALSLLAGCSTDGDRSPDGTDGSATTGSDGTDGGATAESAATGGDLDLREANVTGVEATVSGDQVRFDVTLYHDDDGEPGYANWWQVETLDGERVGRRELLHAHGTREFTRSASFAVPDGADCVVVRGHDETHGYGGQVALLRLDTATVSLRRQGSDRRTFDAAACP